MSTQTDLSWGDGIRSLHPDEFPQLDALLSDVFRPTLVEEYTHFYTRKNSGNFRVVVKNGQVVSHIGTLRRYASILGCTVRVASLGGVATYEKHRGKGYATALLEDTERFCKTDGGDFMLVSGYRKMYHRYGCRYVGRDWNYKITAVQARTIIDERIEISIAKPDDLSTLSAVYQQEPVRWLRPPSDFEYALTGFIMNQEAYLLTVREGGLLQGYVILQKVKKQDKGQIKVLEFAGDRKCLLGALGQLVQNFELEAINLHVMGWDRILRKLLKERDLQGTPANTSGTVTLINFPQFMDRMRPNFIEVVGETASDGLIFYERGNEKIFSYGGDQVIAPDRGTAVELIFGTRERKEEKLLQSGGQAGEILREIFPIPGLWYGLNYV